jgi:hypothetical protein
MLESGTMSRTRDQYPECTPEVELAVLRREGILAITAQSNVEVPPYRDSSATGRRRTKFQKHNDVVESERRKC